jgi:hypothetical protein
MFESSADFGCTVNHVKCLILSCLKIHVILFCLLGCCSPATPHTITLPTTPPTEDPDSIALTQNMILCQQLMDGSTFTLVLGTDGIMQRRIRCEDHKFSVDKCMSGGVCRLLEGSNVERLYHVWTSELSVSELKHAVVQLVEALRYKIEGRGFDSQQCHWDFSLANSFRPHYVIMVDSVSNRNEYEVYSLVGKDSQCIGLTLSASYADCPGNWEPQTPGTHRVYTGIAFCVEKCLDIISVSRFLWFGFNWPMNFQRICNNLKFFF